MRNLAVLLGLGFCFAAFAPSADATTLITETFTGTILDIGGAGAFSSSVTDANFGLPTISVDDTWVATYVFDLNNGLESDAPGNEQRYGGTLYGVASPVVGISLSIGGHVSNLTAASVDYAGSLNLLQFANSSATKAVAADGSSQVVLSNVAGSDDPGVFAGFPTSNADIDLTGAPSSYGSLYDPNDGFFIVVTANLTHLTISVADVSGVPEPSTWAMLLSGLGVSGFWLRIRKRGLVIA